jgi:hypothetical protein
MGEAGEELAVGGEAVKPGKRSAPARPKGSENPVAAARRVMREAFARDPELLRSYVANVAMFLHDNFVSTRPELKSKVLREFLAVQLLRHLFDLSATECNQHGARGLWAEFVESLQPHECELLSAVLRGNSPFSSEVEVVNVILGRDAVSGFRVRLLPDGPVLTVSNRKPLSISITPRPDESTEGTDSSG